MKDVLHTPLTRQELDVWLRPKARSARTPVVLLLLGTSSEVDLFCAHAVSAARRSPLREVVWIKNPVLLTSEEQTTYFPPNVDCLAVVLTSRGTPGARVCRADADPYGAESAFWQAESGGPR